jgi:glycosyltransferase involved in cell wall biosynthesis
VEVSRRLLAVDARCLTGRRTGIATWLAGALSEADPQDLILHIKTGEIGDFPGARVQRSSRAFHLLAAWRTVRAGARYLSPDSLIAPILLGARASVAVHDLAPLARPEMQTRRTRVAYRLMLRLAVRRAGHVIVPSQATRDELLRFAPAARLVQVIPEAGRPLPDPGPTPTHRPAGVSTPYLLFTGTIEPRKNVPVLLKAFRAAELDGWQLVIAGGWGWVSAADRAALEAAAGPQIRLLGYVDDLTLAALYRDAELFVYPSSYEGFGLPVLEAMAAGVAVVTTDDPALRELARGHAALAALNGLSAELTRVLRELGNDPAARTRLAAAGRERAAGFSWSRSSRQILKMVRSGD